MWINLEVGDEVICRWGLVVGSVEGLIMVCKVFIEIHRGLFWYEGGEHNAFWNDDLVVAPYVHYIVPTPVLVG